MKKTIIRSTARWILCCLCMGYVSLYAQFSCRVETRSEVSVGEYFSLKFVLNEKPSAAPRLNLQNFSVVNGPSISSSSSTSIINGKVTSEHSYTYSYTLIAQKEGTFTIPSVTFTSGNEQTKSNAVSIKVNSRSDAADNSPSSPSQSSPQRNTSAANTTFNKNDYFIKAGVSNANPYVGEQVVVHYKLYISAQSSGYQASINSMPSASGCWTYELGDKNAEPKRTIETINGKQYYVMEIRSIAAYPQKEGKTKLSALEMDLTVQVLVRQQRASTGDPFFDAFFGGGISTIPQTMELKLKSEEINLQVKPLPQANQPQDFSGLVGNFNMKSELTKKDLSANDATNLKITVSGNGNLQYVNAPQLNLPADIDAHEPKITDNIHTSPTGVSGSRTFEYILIPRNAGKYTIPAITFSYYDRNKGKYQTLQTEPYTLNVSKAKNGNTVYSSTNKKEDIKILGTDIRHIKTDKKLRQKNFIFLATPWYYLLLLLPFAVLGIILLLLRKKIKENQNIVAVKGKKAAKTAKKRLKKAEQLLKAGADKEFYIEISQVLWGYVSDKFHIPTGQLSLDTAEEQLLNRQMKPEAVEMFLTTLKDCEYVRFAPSADITPQKMYEKTFNFITEIEKELK